jgi:hypothetical protein
MPFPSSRTQPKRRKRKENNLGTRARPRPLRRARAQTLHRRLGPRSGRRNRGHRGGWTGLEAGGREELMAEEAGAPKLSRKRLHRVQREPHEPATGHRDELPPASCSFRWPDGPARDLNVNNVFGGGWQPRMGRRWAAMVDGSGNVPFFLFCSRIFG